MKCNTILEQGRNVAFAACALLIGASVMQSCKDDDLILTGQPSWLGNSIYERLDMQFTIEQAMQQTVAIKGANVTHNSVRQMLKNWKRQGLIMKTETGRFQKMQVGVS